MQLVVPAFLVLSLNIHLASHVDYLNTVLILIAFLTLDTRHSTLVLDTRHSTLVHPRPSIVPPFTFPLKLPSLPSLPSLSANPAPESEPEPAPSLADPSLAAHSSAAPPPAAQPGAMTSDEIDIAADFAVPQDVLIVCNARDSETSRDIGFYVNSAVLRASW